MKSATNLVQPERMRMAYDTELVATSPHPNTMLSSAA
jgi:hypothetical protein